MKSRSLVIYVININVRIAEKVKVLRLHQKLLPLKSRPHENLEQKQR